MLAVCSVTTFTGISTSFYHPNKRYIGLNIHGATLLGFELAPYFDEDVWSNYGMEMD